MKVFYSICCCFLPQQDGTIKGASFLPLVLENVNIVHLYWTLRTTSNKEHTV